MQQHQPEGKTMATANKTTRKKTTYLRLEFRDLTRGSSYPNWQTYTEDDCPADNVDGWIAEKVASKQFDFWREYRLFSHAEKSVTKSEPRAGGVRIEYGPAELIREWKGVPVWQTTEPQK
jgi:hypothetical protein